MARLAGIAAGMLVAWGLVLAPLATAEKGDELTALNMQLGQLVRTRQFEQAVPLAERALALVERRFGREHRQVAISHNNLAEVDQQLGRGGDAIPRLQRELAIAENQRDTNQSEVGNRYHNLALQLRTRGRHAEAEDAARRALLIWEKVYGTDSDAAANASHTLVLTLMDQGKNADAEAPARRALAIWERIHGRNSGAAGNALNTLAIVLMNLSRDSEAEPLIKRVVAIWEKDSGPESGALANALNTLGRLLDSQGRYAEAEPLARRVLAIWEKEHGADSDAAANATNTLAIRLDKLGRSSEAEPFARRALDTWIRVHGADSGAAANAHNTLSSVLEGSGRRAEALEQSNLALEIWAKQMGPLSGAVALGSNNLAFKHLGLGQLADAERLFQRAYDIWSNIDGPERPSTALALTGLADVYYAQSDWRRAYDARERSVKISIARSRRNSAIVGKSLASRNPSEIAQAGRHLTLLVKTGYRLANSQQVVAGNAVSDLFVFAQWGLGSQAAEAVAEMGARNSKRDPALGELVRERQDRFQEWQNKDKSLVAARASPSDRRDLKAEAALAIRLSEIDDRIANIDEILKARFPDYAALTNPEPLSISGVQSQLRDGEALVLFLDTPEAKPTPEETFIWAVTKTDSRWVRSELGTKALQDRVAALRCGLDRAGEWQWSKEKYRWLAKKPACAALRSDGLTKGEPLPFDVAKAHELYAGLFGGIEDLIEGKHLLLVPSGALTSLPFQVLVTGNAVSDPLGQTPNQWLIRRHALTVLPSVASLAALRRNAKTSAAPEPFIGYGNPVLSGQCGSVYVPDKCPDEEIQVAATPADVARSAGSLEDLQSYFRNGLADVSAVRKLCPLPDTAHELKCVAKSLGAPDSSIVLGSDMTETALKKAPLDRYRVVHFATHGLLAGETAKLVQARAEPALVLTPPGTPTEEDDGLLTASEVAGLKLDADWVVMSACNTAGPAGGGQQGSGNEPNAEALSGLARAFFYAGARALLVSHWPVDSYAATMLTSRTFAEMKKDASIGRSEAFRRAMLALMEDKKRPWAAHPSVWAPFVVVGEGAAAR